MKEIVIKIPDNMLDVIKNSENTTWLAVTYGNQLVWQVKNGKVLPKGHGELIDKDKMWDAYHDMDYDFFDAYDIPEVLVEADKGEE